MCSTKHFPGIQALVQNKVSFQSTDLSRKSRNQEFWKHLGLGWYLIKFLTLKITMKNKMWSPFALSQNTNALEKN